MKDLNELLRQARDLQSKMAEAQTKLEAIQISGSAGGGMVTVTLSGKGEMLKVTIAPELLKPEDSEILEDLIIAAHQDAKTKLEAKLSEEMAQITGGLPLPPGMKLPF